MRKSKITLIISTLVFTLLLLTSCDNKSSEVIEQQEIENVALDKVGKSPIYPGCTGENSELKRCLSQNIAELVSNEFNIDLAQNLDLKSGKHRISVQFIIDKNGNTVVIKVRAPHPDLKAETIRIIKLLPKMQPGKQDDKAVNVRYNLPIVFNVED